jgi:shikimate dehydrogenase
VSTTADRYAVAGNPVAHSQSPFIHAAFAEQTGEPVRYERLLCPPDAFAATVRAFAAEGASGCNVTMPFKFEAFTLTARSTPRARLAAACNTLRFDADGWLGDNTDGAGLVRDIERNAGTVLRGARVLLIGAGGGAAGALGALLSAGPREIVVANRSADRAAALVARHADAAAAARVVDSTMRARESAAAGAEDSASTIHPAAALPTRLSAAPLDACGTAYDVVVNASASSVAGALVPVAADVLAPGTLAIDMMYGPAAAPFLHWASAHGARGRDGLGMLVEQAAEAFSFWRGVEPDTAPVLQALRARLAAS